MAYNDWNGDGKRDSSDDYIGYQIYKDCNKKNGNNGGGGCLAAALTFMGAIILVGLFSGIFGIDVSEMSDAGLYVLHVGGILVVGTIIAVIKELF